MKSTSILGLCLILLTGCDSGKKTFAKYEILNDTDNSIRIIVYQSWISNEMSSETVTLGVNGDTWESDKFQTSEPGGQFYPIGSDLFLYGDSVLVEFDNQRRSIHKLSNTKANGILLQENYQKIINDELTIWRYTFTNEDYDNAELISDQ